MKKVKTVTEDISFFVRKKDLFLQVSDVSGRSATSYIPSPASKLHNAIVEIVNKQTIFNIPDGIVAYMFPITFIDSYSGYLPLDKKDKDLLKIYKVRTQCPPNQPRYFNIREGNKTISIPESHGNSYGSRLTSESIRAQTYVFKTKEEAMKFRAEYLLLIREYYNGDEDILSEFKRLINADYQRVIKKRPEILVWLKRH